MTQARRDVLRGVQIDRTTHAGLWLDTYLTFQTTDGKDSDEVKAARTSLIEEVARNTAPDGYGDASEKRAVSLLGPPKGTVRDVRIYRTAGRTIVGLGQKGVIEAGITLERTWGVPILPGSSLKGVAAATAHLLTDHDSWRKPADKESKPGESFAELFGTTENQGRVIFHDAWWLPDSVSQKPLAQDIMTVHHPNYYQKDENDKEFNVPDGTDSPNPISFITTTSGLAFVFCLEAKEADKDWLDAAWKLLDKGLQELGVGAKTNSGYGRFSLDSSTFSGLKTRAIQKEVDRLALLAFGEGDLQKQFELLMSEVTVLCYGEFYQGLANLDPQNPYTLFASSKFSSSFPKVVPDEAISVFKSVLAMHDVFGAALTNGKPIEGLNVGSKTLRELGEKLGLVTAEVTKSELSASDELLARAEDKDNWVDATKDALADTTLPREVFVSLKSLSRDHFGKKLKGEKEKLVDALDRRLRELKT